MRPSNTGIGYNDAMAVAAVTAARESGSDFFAVPSSPLALIRTSYNTATTPVLTAGVFSLTTLIYVTGSNSGTLVDIDAEIDGVPLGVVLSTAGRPGGGFIFSGTFEQTWSAGAHTVEYFAWQTGGPGTAAAVLTSTTWSKVR